MNKFSLKTLSKRTKIIAIAVLAVILATVICVVVIAAQKKENTPIIAFENCYDMVLNFDDKMDTATLTTELMYTNTAGTRLSSLVFHLYPNAFANLPVGKSGRIDILSAKIDRLSVTYAISGKDNTILTLPCSLDMGDTASVIIDAKITIPTSDRRFGKTDYTVNMTAFYPMLSVFENGAWRVDEYSIIGDPFMSETASYYLTTTLPAEFAVASSGKISEVSESSRHKTFEISAEHVRDFALIASAKFLIEHTTVKLGDTSVVASYYYLDDVAPTDTLNLAVNALTAFSRAFGNYPYASYSVVQTPLVGGGMEYGGLVQVLPMSNRKAANETLIHETAHQWWFGVVGSDQFNNAWLDEGLSEFCTGYYYRLIGENAQFDEYVSEIAKGFKNYQSIIAADKNKSMERHLTAFVDESEYVGLVYYKGALLFNALEKEVGQEKFVKSLATYFKNNSMKIASKASLFSAFAANGCDISNTANAWLCGSLAV